MAIDSWHERSRSTVFEKYGRSVERVVFQLPDGAEETYYIKAERPTACVVAITVDRKVALVRQFRPGPLKVLHELPGGFVGPDEDPTAAMERELLEETGLAGHMKLVTSIVDDAYSTVIRHCFVATDCELVSEPQLDPTEFLELEFMTIPEFRALLRSGQMTDVESGYLALDHLGLLH